MNFIRIPVLLVAAALGTALSAPLYSQDPAPAPQAQSVPTLAEATQLMREAKWEEASIAFGLIVLSDQENGVAWMNLGYCLHANGDLDRALQVHLKAATFEQFKSTALYNVGCVHALKGDVDKAFDYLNQALAARPIPAAQFSGDADLTSLHKDKRWAKLMMKLDPNANKPQIVKEAPLPSATDKADDGLKKGKAISLAKLPAERRFDFWIGEWEMYMNGEFMSRQSVKSTLDGASILQSGPQSMTLAVFDPTSGQWNMTWTSTAGHHDILVGNMDDKGQMVMNQKVLRDRPGDIGKWILRDIYKNHFMADWMTSKDGGKTWNTEAVMEYKRFQNNIKDKVKAQNEQPKKAGQSKAIAGLSKNAPPQTRQYVFMLGSWMIEAEAMKPDQTWTKGGGEIKVHFADDGVTLVEDMTLNLEGLGEFAGQSRRVYNPDSEQWDIRWMPKGQDAVFEIVGKKKDGKMVEYSTGTDQYGAFKDTVYYTDITKNSFKVWMDRAYTETGHKVEGLYRATMTRIR